MIAQGIMKNDAKYTKLLYELISVTAPKVAADIVETPTRLFSDYPTIFRSYGIRLEVMHEALRLFAKEVVEIEYDEIRMFKKKPNPIRFPSVIFKGAKPQRPLQQSLFSNFPHNHCEN